MEDKKAYKIGLMPLFLLVLDIILIIVVIVMGLIIHNKNQIIAGQNNVMINNSENEENNDINIHEENSMLANEINDTIDVKNANTDIINNDTNINTNTTNNSNNTLTGVTPKIVETRSYIYDAGYPVNGVTTNSYTTNDGVNHSILDIVVPYINMESDDATQMNSEIEKLYNGYVEEFKKCSQNLNSYIKVNYTTYVTSNIYSILMTIERGQEDDKITDYLAYNFDIISGTKLDYNQLCFVAGINNSAESVKNSISTLEDYSSYYLYPSNNVSQEAVDQRNAKILNCQNQVYTLYQEDLLNSQLVYFLDNNLKLNISVKVILPNSDGSYNKIMIIEA